MVRRGRRLSESFLLDVSDDRWDDPLRRKVGNGVGQSDIALGKATVSEAQRDLEQWFAKSSHPLGTLCTLSQCDIGVLLCRCRP